MNTVKPVLRIVGSLRFAAVLLILLMVAMACATVFESMHSTGLALAVFYKSWWFVLLLYLLAVNVLAALLLRYPFSKRQVGFVVTHVSILVILAGAWITRFWGIEGQVALAEGQTVSRFTQRDQPILTVTHRHDGTHAALDLDPSIFGGFEAVEQPDMPELALGTVKVRVTRYLPDSRWFMRMVDDNPHPEPAVEVSLSPSGRDDPTWVLTRKPEQVGSTLVAFRTVSTADELLRLIDAESAASPGTEGTVKIVLHDRTFEIPLDQCSEQAAPVGDTGYTVRVLRYLPHATVGPDSRITNASPQPVNPFIEAELTAPDGSRETRMAFARYPDYGSLHGNENKLDLKLTFVTSAPVNMSTPVEVVGGPEGELYARFGLPDGQIISSKLTVGTPVETPWPGRKFAVLQRLEHARMDWFLMPELPVRENRQPAIRLRLSAGRHTSDLWLQKYQVRSATIDGTPLEAAFDNKQVPLGFDLTLDRFHIGYYPGGHSHRSYESHITIRDPDTGKIRQQVVSMNNPVKQAGFSLYQSQFRQEPGRTISILGVARDPGKPVIFTGYIAMMIGMVLVLITRATSGAHASPQRPDEGRSKCRAKEEDRGRQSSAPIAEPTVIHEEVVCHTPSQ